MEMFLVAVKLTEEEAAEQLKEADFDLSDTAVPRRFYVTTKLLKEHGFLPSVKGAVPYLKTTRSKRTAESAGGEYWRRSASTTPD